MIDGVLTLLSRSAYLPESVKTLHCAFGRRVYMRIRRVYMRIHSVWKRAYHHYDFECNFRRLVCRAGTDPYRNSNSSPIVAHSLSVFWEVFRSAV